MSRFAQTFISQLPKSKTAVQLLEKHIVMLNVVTGVLLVAFILGYIAQVNGSVATGYQMRALEERIQTLGLENQQLEVESRRVQALNHVAHNVKMLGLVDGEQPTYINGGAPSYALAE